MKRFMLILFIGLELSYYLLIVQTGLVEYLRSDLLLIAPLPIGGIIGSLLVYFTDIHNENKISFFISIQLLISFFYPHLSFIMLFFLGLSAGALAPLMINELKKAQLIDIGLALGLSYSIGTALFNYDVTNRTWIAIAFSAIILLISRFLPTKIQKIQHNKQHSLLIMLAWIFLDSALFETLSRDTIIPIWRLGLSGEIIFFHLLGIFLALYIKASHRHKEIVAFVLFSLSYLLYFTKEPTLLAAIYPVVISYYNVLILQTLLQKELKTIGIFMIFIAWIASGAGLVVALNGLTIIMPTIVILSLLRYTNKIKQKDIQCLKY
jgi:beta-carotene 15,15'-dioxygenase